MKRRAFTLVELLVVIAIVGLLSSVAIVSVNNSRDKAAIASGQQFENSVYHSVGSEAVAYWDFEEGTGTSTNDSSGNGKIATLVNGVTWACASANKLNTPSGQGCALSFDGVNDYATTAVTGVTDGTVSVWFKNLSSTPGDVILGRRTTGCFSSAIYLNGSELRIYNTGPEVVIGTIKNNQWTHLTVVRTGAGSQALFYLNGRLALQNSFDLNLNDLVSMIGGTCAGIGSFGGQIDNVRIYGAALNAAAVKKLFAFQKDKYQ